MSDPLDAVQRVVRARRGRRAPRARGHGARHRDRRTACRRCASCCSRASTSAASSSSPTTSRRKGRELAANPRAALAVLWKPLQRQVRLEGRGRGADAARSPTPTSRPARAARSSAPGRRRQSRGDPGPRVARGAAGASSTREYPDDGAAPAALGRLPARAGRRSSSGRAARTACTTARRSGASTAVALAPPVALGHSVDRPSVRHRTRPRRRSSRRRACAPAKLHV